MIPALLRGKLTFRQENMEDILTSNVFGLFQYVPPECGLLQFLAQARTLEGDCYPLAPLLTQDGSSPTTVEYEFWPRWQHCEPDLALHIRHAPPYLIGIEAKYWSGKSSRVVEADIGDVGESDEGPDEEEPNDNGESENCLEAKAEEEVIRQPSDQLANEWTDLVVRASELRAQPVLVYLTADLHCPKAELLESINDCASPVGGLPKPVICWLSWRELPRLFRFHSDRHLADVARLADKMELTFYEGISPIAPIQADWIFEGPTWRFDVAPIKCDWRFAQ